MIMIIIIGRIIIIMIYFMILYPQLERVNAALPASQAQLAAASERADAQLAEVKSLEFMMMMFYDDEDGL